MKRTSILAEPLGLTLLIGVSALVALAADWGSAVGTEAPAQKTAQEETPPPTGKSVLLPAHGSVTVDLGEVPSRDDAEEIAGVVVRLGIDGVSPPSVDLSLGYDADLDGDDDLSVPLPIHLAYWESGTLPERWSCPAELNTLYEFQLDGSEEALTEEDARILSSFVGAQTGGRFSLRINETSGSDGGFIWGWSLDVARRPAPDHYVDRR